MYHSVILLFPAPLLPPLPWLAEACGHCQGSGVKQLLECTNTSVASLRHLGFIRWPKIGFGGVKSVQWKGWGRQEGGMGRQGVAFTAWRGLVAKLLSSLCTFPQQSSPHTSGLCQEKSFPGLAVPSFCHHRDAQSLPFTSELSEVVRHGHWSPGQGTEPARTMQIATDSRLLPQAFPSRTNVSLWFNGTISCLPAPTSFSSLQLPISAQPAATPSLQLQPALEVSDNHLPTPC